MCKIVLENLAYISQHVGKSADYTQGGGAHSLKSMTSTWL